MPNQFQSIQSGLAELKNYYQGPIVDQFNNETPLYRGASKGKHAWSGQQVVRPLRVRRNQGIGATSDGGVLPAIGRQTTQQAIIPSKFNYLRFGITGPMIKASASDVGSFVRSAAYELEQGYKDLQSDVNRQLGWDGTGWLATMAANAVAATSITISGRESTEAALKFLDVDLVFDVYTTGGVVVQQGVTIQAITSGNASSATAVLTVSPALTASSGNVLVRANSFGNEIQGLLYALDGGTTTIYNIDRSTYISYQGNVLDLNAQQLSLDFMQQAYNEGLRRGAAKYDAGYYDFNTQRMYQKLLTADKRYVNTVKGDGGFADKDKSYLDYNGVPMVADKDFPTRLVFLPSNTITKYVLAEMEFADETGTMYIAQVSADQLETRVRLFCNLFNEQPAACALILDYLSP